MISAACGVPSAVPYQSSFLDRSRNPTPRPSIVNACRVDNQGLSPKFKRTNHDERRSVAEVNASPWRGYYCGSGVLRVLYRIEYANVE